MNFSFPPDSNRSNLIANTMRLSLADSLIYLEGKLNLNFHFNTNQYHSIISNIKNGQPYSCFLFALYTKLVLLINSKQYEKIENILDLITQQQPLDKNTLNFVTLDSKEFFGYGSLLAEMMNIEEGTDFKIVSSDQGSYKKFEKRLTESFQVIDQYLPELGAEIKSLITQIIMVEPSKDSQLLFDGGSSYMLWGGLFLNAKSHDTIIALIEVLAHEASHMLLFGFASDEPLATNPDNDRYSSPLRDEPRPIEGIFHAMFASARMFWAMYELSQNKTLTQNEKEYIDKRIIQNLEAFSDAYNVVKKHGILTKTGLSILNETYAYMSPFLLKHD